MCHCHCISIPDNKNKYFIISCICACVLILFVCILLFTISHTNTDEQSIDGGGKKHEYIEYGVSANDKQTIVNKHNELRKLIANGQVPGQPRGINLKRMVWDNYLADKAQEIANTCDYRHQEVTDRRWGVGQNLYRQRANKMRKGTDWDRAVQVWFDEHTLYKYTDSYVFNKPAGHYTQVVWADTTHVGCGYTYYPYKKMYHKFYVCNYGPGCEHSGSTRFQIQIESSNRTCEHRRACHNQSGTASSPRCLCLNCHLVALPLHYVRIFLSH